MEDLNGARSIHVKDRVGMKSIYIAIVVFYFALPIVSSNIFDAMKCAELQMMQKMNSRAISYL